MSDSLWTNAELCAAVQAYLEMLALEQRGEQYVKTDFNRRLREGPLSERSKKSVEFRMQNISAVLDEDGSTWISGYKPAKHVGPRAAAMIRQCLDNRGGIRTRSR